MSSNNPENPYGQPTPPNAYAQPAPVGYAQPYGAPAQVATDPGKTMSIIAIVLPFVGLGLVGLILGIVAMVKSKKAGFKNTLALIAIIISALAVIGSIIALIALGIYTADLTTQITNACKDGADTATVAGQVVDCSAVR